MNSKNVQFSSSMQLSYAVVRQAGLERCMPPTLATAMQNNSCFGMTSTAVSSMVLM